MRMYLVTIGILLLLFLSGTTAQNAANAVTIQEQDFTGDGTVDVKMDNGIMWLQVNRDTPSGAKGFIDAGGITGGPNLIRSSIASVGMVDQVVYWQPESYAIDILENSSDRGMLRVTVVDTGNGKEITREFTITLLAGAQNSWIDYLFTNTGDSPFYYDQDPGHIHDGAILAAIAPVELYDIDAYINDVGVIGLPSLTWWHSYAPNPSAPFGVLYRPSNGDAVTFGFKSWSYPIHQIVAYYTGAAPDISPVLDFMASEFTLDVGESAQWSAVVAFHDGGYLVGIDIYNQATQPPAVGWCDDFETYTEGSNLPSPPWHLSGNPVASVENANAINGTQSVRLYGITGECWGSLAMHPLGLGLPLSISMKIRNGSEDLFGCHPYRASLDLKDGTDWFDPTPLSFFAILEDGSMWTQFGTNDTITGLPLGTAFNVRIDMYKPGDGLLHGDFYINSVLSGSYAIPEAVWMDSLPLYNLDIAAQEGTVWFDDVCISNYVPNPNFPDPFCDNFESYRDPGDWTQNWHGSGNVEGITVDNTTAFTGSLSLKMFGQLGSCWGAVATRPIQMDLPLEISFAMKNGSELLSGCHPYRSVLSLRTGPDWPDCPCPGLLVTLPNGDIQIPQQSGAEVFSGYALDMWHSVRCILWNPADGFLHMKFWVNGGFLGEFTLPYESWMSGAAYLDISANEGTAWFDDVCVAAAPTPAAAIWIDTTTVADGFVQVMMRNAFDVSAFTLPLLHNSAVPFDSVSSVDCRTANWQSFAGTSHSASTLLIGGIADMGGGIPCMPVGEGPVAKIYFPRTCFDTFTVAFDTTYINEPGKLLVVDCSASSYTPSFTAGAGTYETFLCGDINADCSRNIADVVYLIRYIFTYGAAPVPANAGDVNGDCSIDIADAVYYIGWVFSGGSEPVCGRTNTGPFAKPYSGAADVDYSTESGSETASLTVAANCDRAIRGVQLEFSIVGDADVVNVTSEIADLQEFHSTVDGVFKVGLLDMTGKAVIPAGQNDFVRISYTGKGEIKLVSAIVVGDNASKMNVTIKSSGAVSPNGALPLVFALSQNMPNPFNPTTEINYALPKASLVRLEVFNVLGQVVRTLVDEFQGAGNHNAVWDGSDDNNQKVSSGVYFYSISAGEYAETKKMVLMK